MFFDGYGHSISYKIDYELQETLFFRNPHGGKFRSLLEGNQDLFLHSLYMVCIIMIEMHLRFILVKRLVTY